MKSGMFVVFHYDAGQRVFYTAGSTTHKGTRLVADALIFDTKKAAFTFALCDPKYRVGEIESTPSGMIVSAK